MAKLRLRRQHALFLLQELFLYKNGKLKNAQSLRTCKEHPRGSGKAKNFCWIQKSLSSGDDLHVVQCRFITELGGEEN